MSLFSFTENQPEPLVYEVVNNVIQVNEAVSEAFKDLLRSVLLGRGLWPRQIPTLNKVEVPYLKLFIAVEHLGGAENLRFWKFVAELMDVDAGVTNVSFILKNKYFQLIAPVLPYLKERFALQQKTPTQICGVLNQSPECGTCSCSDSDNFLMPLTPHPTFPLSRRVRPNITLRSLHFECVKISDTMFRQIFQLYPYLEHVILCWLGEVTTLPDRVSSRLKFAELFGLSSSVKDQLFNIIMRKDGVYQFHDRETECDGEVEPLSYQPETDYLSITDTLSFTFNPFLD